jgi:hypothetical protein
MTTLKYTQSFTNQLPRIAITSPLPGSIFEAGADITLQAEASDPDGAVVETEFFAGETALGKAPSTSPSLSWKRIPPGDYSLSARAHDDRGGIQTSQPVPIRVYVAPQFIRQPIDQTVSPEGMLILTATATSYPSPSYQWQLNGQDISGAISSTLRLGNVHPTNSGSYRVIAANLAGSLISDAAQITVAAAQLPFADNFADRKVLNARAGAGSGSNALASTQPAEPNHAGKTGGHSLWVTWIAPNSGVATFRTTGSSFDTLLAVYQADVWPDLIEIGSDDDRGGFLTSLVAFNAVAGAAYQIAVDGFGGETGNVVLSWDLDTRGGVLPRLISPPANQTVGLGDNATFRVVAASDTPLNYQWFFNCAQIPNATNSTLIVTNVQPAQLGLYFVRVGNAQRSVDSLPASLQINQTGAFVAKVQAYDKLPEVLLTRTAVGVELQAVNRHVALSSVSVAQGATALQIFNTFGASKDPGEPNHCGIVGGASYWFGIKAAANGLMSISTEGSDFDTILAVYTWPGTILAALENVACDNNSASDGKDSFVRFDATGGTTYYVVVDGVNGVTGTVRLSYSLDQPPVPVSAARALRSFAGEFRATTQRNYRVQATVDLRQWVDLFTTNRIIAPAFHFDDPNAYRYRTRFYRAVPVP